ncbi:16S rRNA processing protein RimM [Silicimonas algicola]|uniref:Ribosome maturation factor RimM n=1 Tax=Silicimonas algicola TaxID=1826607 RepID=A0A316GGB3_9RHOB|nr:ribosome maturation factor RimM [Silicimonas algicola]AZQ66126.1 16S rRNA processing protein RimM [Silicimonas algicola]PWK58430.1 16S rRNA processing protein RimM [Silicimonas algicola]
MSETVCVGAIAGSFGVRGEVRLKSFCAEPEAIATYGPLSSEDGKASWAVTLARPVKGGFAARLTGVTTKEAADTLRGVRLYAPRDRLPALPDDEFYHADLIDLAVFDTGGVEIGRVRAVLNHGAGDLLEIQVPGQKAPVLLPFTREVVPTVDLGAGRLVADPPEGLME